MAICKICGQKYGRWTNPVSAHGVCGDCFEVELSNEREAEQQKEDVPPAPMAQETPATKPIVPIRWSSFLPRSRSTMVFALVMFCYCWAISSFISGWRYAAHVRSPPRAFYLRGDVADVVALLLVAPIIESLVLIGVIELVRRAHARISLRFLWPRSSSANCTFGRGGHTGSLCCRPSALWPPLISIGVASLGNRLSGS